MLLRLSLSVWVLVLAALAGAQKVPVTGVSVPSGQAVPLRKNINNLYSTGGPQWDLYVQALNALYSQDSQGQLSFFQIAGIHGRPFRDWNGSGARTSDGWQGFCPHGENLFLTWHRPYILLYEQRLVEIALQIANRYPTAHRATYQKAARELRAPYWDWSDDSRVPPCTVPSTHPIRVPDGNGLRTSNMRNPLRGYKFPSRAIKQEFGSFSRDPEIYKCRAPQSYPNSANQLMSRRSYKQWTYDAFTRARDFTDFASTGSSGISLEMIHNAVHWDGSCGEQFLNADYSAFDPLFMLHHAQVDRLWAYWQFIKPQHATFQKSYRGGARWGTPSNTNIGPTNPLKPFYQANGRFHTSDSVKSIKNFGYTYEGLEYWRKSDSQMQRDATALINRMYASGAVRPMLRKRDSADDGEVTRYFAQISVTDVTQLARPCEISLYANNTAVGNWIVMQQPATGSFFGKFALDNVADPEALKDETTRLVVSDLLQSLRVEIKRHDGTVQALADVPSLKLELENVDVLPPESDTELPEYHDAEQRQAPKKEFRKNGSRA